MSQPGTILLAMTGFDPVIWRQALERHAPDRPIVTEPAEPGDPSIRYAVAWHPEPGSLADLPNLAAIFSAGAGVDHVFADTGLPPNVPIVRSVAADLTERMSEYVVWQVLDHHRKGPRYRRQQAGAVWNEDRMQPPARDVTVGIMGLGVLGLDAAGKLDMMGFRLAGWSRTRKKIDGIATYHGEDELEAFLKTSDIVVCLLPLTPATRGILSKPLFARMKRRGPLGPAILINAGRGGLQNEADIVAALDNGWLGGVTLDVFQTEPLPEHSPLWAHPRVTITPHAAATSMPDALVPPMIAQMEAFERGGTLRNVVDRESGY